MMKSSDLLQSLLNDSVHSFVNVRAAETAKNKQIPSVLVEQTVLRFTAAESPDPSGVDR